MEIPLPIFFTIVWMCSAHDSWLSVIEPSNFTLSNSLDKLKFMFGADDGLWLDLKIVDLVFKMFYLWGHA